MRVTPEQFSKATGIALEALYKRLQTGQLGPAAQKSGRRWSIDLEAGWSELGRTDELDKLDIPEDRLPVGPDGPLPTREESLTIEKFWNAKILELKYREAAAGLIDRNKCARLYTEEMARCKAHLSTIPERIRMRFPQFTPAELALVRSMVDEALEQLGANKTDGDPNDD